MSRIRTFFKIFLPVLVFLLLLRMPGPQGLSVQGQRVLAVTAFSVILWVTEALNSSVVGFIAVILLTLTSAVPSLKGALYGFSQPLVYFLFCVLTIAVAATKTGLAESVARWLINRSGGSIRKLYFQLVVSFAAFSYLVPSATTRNCIQIPAYEETLRLQEFDRDNPVSKVIMLAMSSLNSLGSTALLTGGIAPVTAAALIGGFSWGRWFILMALPYYIMLTLGSLFVYVLYRPAGGYEKGKGSLAAASHKLSGDEKKVAAIVVISILLWATDSFHHLNSSLIALMAGVVVMLPSVGVLNWKEMEAELPWSTLFVMATSLCVGYAITSSGAAAWFAERLVGASGFLSGNPELQLLLLMVMTSLVRLILPEIAALYSIMIPLAIVFAQRVGLNPIVCGLVVTIVPDAVIFYPAQSSSSIMVYEKGWVGTKDFFRVAVGMTAVSYLTVFFVALPFWRLLGERLVP